MGDACFGGGGLVVPPGLWARGGRPPVVPDSNVGFSVALSSACEWKRTGPPLPGGPSSKSGAAVPGARPTKGYKLPPLTGPSDRITSRLVPHDGAKRQQGQRLPAGRRPVHDPHRRKCESGFVLRFAETCVPSRCHVGRQAGVVRMGLHRG